jgi:hypothetical protein
MLTACCGPAAELIPVYVEKTPVEVSGGYAIGKAWLGTLQLYGHAYECRDDSSATCYPTLVEETVVKIGWNQDYIVGERHPRDLTGFSKPDASNPAWFIIVVDSATVYQDLVYDEFVRLAGELDIPRIEMQDAKDVYRRE